MPSSPTATTDSPDGSVLVFGGTFDPVHNGHLAIARQARVATGAGAVWFVPAAIAPLRDPPRATPEERLELLLAACSVGGEPGMAVLDLAIRRGGISYTADVMDALRSEFPERDLSILIGADAARTIARWHRAGDLLGTERFVIVNRSGPPPLDACRVEPARLRRLANHAAHHRFAGHQRLRASVRAARGASRSTAWCHRWSPRSSRRKGCTARIGTMHNANRMTSTDLAGIIAAAATDKKARDVVILDIRGKTTIADYFVICEGDTDRQVRAITDNITDICKAHGLRALAVAGLKDASWACADFDSVIAHVFLPGERTFYDLEGLWGDPAGERAV